ncbi:MAG: hypothetical protein ACK58L_05310 [Planctomycetota bacterium]
MMMTTASALCVVLVSFQYTAFATNLQAPSHPSEKGIVIQLNEPLIRLEVTDDGESFRIVNVDRRFSASELIRFLKGFSKLNPELCVVVESQAKRLVEGEEEVTKALKLLAKDKGAKVIFLPPPTGSAGDEALQEFSRNFK